MIKQIISAAILLTIASESISQTSNDTICLPASQLKKAINLIEKGKVTEEELNLTKSALKLSENRIAVKDSIILNLNNKETAYKSIIQNYKKNLENVAEMVENLENSITLERKRVKRQKFSKWVLALGGLGLGVLITK